MEKRHIEKGKRFEFLVSQIDKALDNGFYVEALSITYALFEERTYKLLELLHIPFTADDKLYSCLNMLESAISADTVAPICEHLSQTEFIKYLKEALLDSNLVSDIQTWRKKRNDVIHDLAKETIDYESLSIYAHEGRDLFGNFTSSIMRIKGLRNH